jgi:SH3-like domain-containing protein
VRADTRTSLVEITLRKLPGENQDAVATYATGVKVEVLEVKGRWIKVKIDKSVGWVPRTKLSEPAASATAPVEADPRSHRLGVQVRQPDAMIRARPDAGAAVVAPVAPGAALTVLDGDAPGWLHVDDGHGHAGWIAAAAVADVGAAALPVDVAPPPSSAASTRARARPSWTLRGTASIGYRSIDQRFTSNATGGLANYAVSADASAAEIGVTALPRLGKLRLGADAAARFTSSNPGIDYPGPTLAPGEIPFTMFEARGTARVGYRLGPITPQLRLGGFYGAFLADEVANAGRLPREALWAATAGLGVEVAPPRAKVTIEARADVALVGARAQTDGLAGGMSSTVGAQWFELRLAYAVAPHVAVVAGFTYERYATDWSGASERWAGVTDAHRLDHAQLVSFGIGAGR